MARKPAGPPVVAELGRPETPAETAARKAKTSREHGQARTTRNLVWALVGTLLVLLVIVLGVPRQSTPIDRGVDVATAGAEVQRTRSEPVAVPELDSGWRANAAELRTDDDDVTAWYTGWVTPGGQYLGMYQGFDADADWGAGLVGASVATTTAEVDGVSWTVFDNRSAAGDVGNARYGMVAEAGSSAFVLLGTAEPAEFAAFAAAIAPAVTAARSE